jgi:putative ABC transport system permease protein
MTWIQLSCKEWQRRPLRTSVAAAGVAIATAGCFSLLSFQRGYRDGIQRELDHLGAHVLLVPKGCPYDAASMALHGASWPCYLKQTYLDEVRNVPGVLAAAPVFMAAVPDGNSNQVVYVGVETNILQLRPAWRIKGDFLAHDGDLLVGSEAAEHYGWRLGQLVPLPGLKGQARVVAGILAPTHGADDAFIHLRLTAAQQLFHHPKELTHILVRLSDPTTLEQAVSQLRGCDAGLVMNVVPLEHIFRTLQSLVSSTRVLLACIAMVALLVAGAGVTNTVLMAVAERGTEIGVLRAIGASRANIFRLVWLETVQTCLAGAIVGVGLAYLASNTVEIWVRSKLPFSPSEALIRWDWFTAAACLAAVAVLGSLAGILPAWRAGSVPPMIAMRTGGHR